MVHWKQLTLLLLLAALSAFAQPPAALISMESTEILVGAESGATPITAPKKTRAATLGPKPGASGGKEAGKKFPPEIKDAAEKEAGGKCVFCGQETTRETGPNQRNTDHAVPKSRDGSATLENAQNTCRTCNLKKGTKTTEEFLQEQKE
jgi:hypothetical protein